MKNWKIIGAITLLVLAIAALRIVSYERERNAPGVVVNKPAQRQLSDDQMVFVRTMLIDSMKSARVLNGKSVWMKTGYTEAAGHCLVSSASHNGHDVIVVALGDNKNIWIDSYRLLAWGLAKE